MQHAPYHMIMYFIKSHFLFSKRKDGKKHCIVLALEVLKYCMNTRGVEPIDIRDI